MKTFQVVAALGVVLGLPAAASAAAPQDSSSGRYEWRSAPQYGPRAPLHAPQRVLVPRDAERAACDCPMMRTSAADRMKAMPGLRASPSGS